MRVAILTTGRQDWGILRSTCLALRGDPAFDLRVFAGGMHCSERHGRTIRLLEEDGLAPHEALAWVPASGEAPVTNQAAEAIRQVGEALQRQRPDALMLAGDRFETAAAALAATLSLVPLVHLHGGEETEGAFDNALRHAITKLSHLHLVSHPGHRDRVIAMGEDPRSVHLVGAPGLDNLHRADLASRVELEQVLGAPLTPPVVVVTVHPTTLARDMVADARAVAEAMDAVEATYVITLPNADPASARVREILLSAAKRARRSAVDALGDRRFWGLLRLADAMLGNSSAALIEAPVLQIPAVNVGDRQRGRERGLNVLDVPSEATAIAEALRTALEPSFRRHLDRTTSPFGDGHSATRIVEVLRSWTPPSPPIKRGPGGTP